MSVARHLWSEPVRFGVRLISITQFHFCEEQSLIGTFKLIDLKGMSTAWHEVTHFFYQSAMT